MLMNCPVRTSSFLAAVAAVIGLVGLCTFAEHVQAQANAPPAVAPAPRLKLTTEQEYIIREIVLKDLNVQKENSAPETIGDSVPDDVKLYPLPPEVNMRNCGNTRPPLALGERSAPVSSHFFKW
jgi:hypothetical protein